MPVRPLPIACALALILHVGALGWLQAADLRTRPAGHVRVALRKPLQPAKLGPAAAPAPAKPTPGWQAAVAPTDAPTNHTTPAPAPAADLPVVATEAASPAEELAPVPLGAFVEPDQLSQSASPAEAIDLDLPEARLLRDPGLLLLRLWIDVRGHVIHSEVESSSFPDAYTDAVVRAFASRLFTPGQRDGQAVNSVLRLEVRYE